MRRRLVLINLVLFAATGFGLWRFRTDYRLANERYRILKPAAPAKVTPPAPARPAGPVQPGSYLDAAARYLFSPDRNPTVVVEAPKVKPRPALPQLYGVMDIGEGPVALMSTKGEERHRPVRIGETIGEFKLLAAGPDRITLEWDGQAIEAQASDLLPRPRPEPAQGAARTPGASAPRPSGGGSSATVLNPNAKGGEFVIGPAMQGATGTIYSSPPGDTAPHGTVHQGKRKVVRQTPFGQQSWWEDVK
jgi:hypothetical protein